MSPLFSLAPLLQERNRGLGLALRIATSGPVGGPSQPQAAALTAEKGGHARSQPKHCRSRKAAKVGLCRTAAHAKVCRGGPEEQHLAICAGEVLVCQGGGRY